MIALQYCPGTLAPNHNTYSKTCLNQLFNGRKVSHLLPYSSNPNSVDTEQLRENRKRISISGVQAKVSLLLDKNKLRLTQVREQGQYILKPIPYDVKFPEYVPANEHLTMQIARQVYKIPTADNAMIFFNDGTPAYITRRFDYKSDGSKYGQEDFASLSNQTKENGGADFKYKGSYEQMGHLIKQYVPASIIECSKFFRLVMFNYLFSNGDAHLKNFSLLESSFGDYLLSPAYDLLCTSLHVNDGYFALENGLFTNENPEIDFHSLGYYTGRDFGTFAEQLKLPAKVITDALKLFRFDFPLTKDLISRSFLSEDLKATYQRLYLNRLRALNQ
ncbi:MAG: HipA domain-containing protein [Bacteroidota bacterium]